MRLSLRYRLLAPLGLLLLGDFVATGWAARVAADRAERRIAEQLRDVARTLSEPPTFPLSTRVLEQMRGLSGAEFLLVRQDSSRTGTFEDPLPDPPPTDQAPTPDPTDGVVLGPSVRVVGEEYRCLRVPLHPPHPNEGGVLYIFYPETARRTAVADAVRPLLLLGGVGGVLAVGLMVLLSARLVERVRTLQRQTRTIAAGNFQPLPLPRSEDELRDLYGSVNEMATRLAEYRDALMQTERLRVLGQFSGGLAHQLRNAAAGAKLALQLHLIDCDSKDREPLDVALRQLDRMEANLSQFLALGKPPPTEKKTCDLAAIITHAVELLLPQCRHAGTALNWTPPPAPALLLGDVTLLGHLFSNVIGNAVEAAGPGGVVDVVLIPTRSASEGAFLIEIADTGPGPPPHLADRLFDPFVTGKDQGIGLGLAVAKQAADAHDGRVSWERRDGRTVFAIVLPVSRESKTSA